MFYKYLDSIALPQIYLNKGLIMTNVFKLVASAALILLLSACGGGGSSSKDASGCVRLERVSGGAEYTNRCNFKVNVAVFDPLFRFSLEAGETTFLARTESLSFGVCDAPDKPREESSIEFSCS